MMKKRFFRCEHCGNLAELIVDAGVKLVCCGQPMSALEANAKDAALEKHVPAVSVEGTTVKVQIGETLHPMTAEHYIQWIALIQGNKIQRVDLTPDDEPKACFTIEQGKPFAVYEYCNLHGLWVKE